VVVKKSLNRSLAVLMPFSSITGFSG